MISFRRCTAVLGPATCPIRSWIPGNSNLECELPFVTSLVRNISDIIRFSIVVEESSVEELGERRGYFSQRRRIDANADTPRVSSRSMQSTSKGRRRFDHPL